jgi:hypothetical protein
MLEAMLKQKGIVFQENNDISVIVDKGFKSIPYLAVDDVFMDFYKAKEWVMNYKN